MNGIPFTCIRDRVLLFCRESSGTATSFSALSLDASTLYSYSYNYAYNLAKYNRPSHLRAHRAAKQKRNSKNESGSGGSNYNFTLNAIVVEEMIRKYPVMFRDNTLSP